MLSPTPTIRATPQCLGSTGMSESNDTITKAAKRLRAAILAARPDLVIADLSLRDNDGLEMLADIRKRDGDLPALMLSVHETPDYASGRCAPAPKATSTSGRRARRCSLPFVVCWGGERYVSPTMTGSLGR